MALPDYNIALKHINGKLDWLGILKFLWYRRQIDQGRVIAVCSLPEYRRKLVPLALIYLGMKGGIQKGKPYQRAELSWVFEDNMPSRKLIEASGGTIYKTYRIYEKNALTHSSCLLMKTLITGANGLQAPTWSKPRPAGRSTGRYPDCLVRKPAIFPVLPIPLFNWHMATSPIAPPSKLLCKGSIAFSILPPMLNLELSMLPGWSALMLKELATF